MQEEATTMKIPKFKALEEAADFWDVHNFEDYVEDTEAVGRDRAHSSAAKGAHRADRLEALRGARSAGGSPTNPRGDPRV